MSVTDNHITVLPRYASIEAVRDICEPWIELWGGDEWGESMRGLRTAAKTSYGFADEDCALFAQKLFENLLLAQDWAEGYYSDEGNWLTAGEEAKKSRDYWLAGGNLGDWGTAKDDAKATIDQMPAWLFGE